MLEYFLETYICVNYEQGDTSLDDFFSTYVVFMPTNQICARLIAIYKARPQQRLGENVDLALQEKVKVIRFILEWYEASRETFFEDAKVQTFLDVRCARNHSAISLVFIVEGIASTGSSGHEDLSAVERRNQINRSNDWQSYVSNARLLHWPCVHSSLRTAISERYARADSRGNLATVSIKAR